MGEDAQGGKVVALLQRRQEAQHVLSALRRTPRTRRTPINLSWTAGFRAKKKVAPKMLHAMVAGDGITSTSKNAALMSDAGLNCATTVPGLIFKSPCSYGNEMPSACKNRVRPQDFRKGMRCSSRAEPYEPHLPELRRTRPKDHTGSKSWRSTGSEG